MLALNPLELNESVAQLQVDMHIRVDSLAGVAVDEDVLVVLLSSGPNGEAKGLLQVSGGLLVFEGLCGGAPDRIRVDSGIRLTTTRFHRITLRYVPSNLV